MNYCWLILVSNRSVGAFPPLLCLVAVIYFFLAIYKTLNLIFPLFHWKEALSKFQEVTNNLEFARELQKSFLTLGQEVGPELCMFTSSVIKCLVYTLTHGFRNTLSGNTTYILHIKPLEIIIPKHDHWLWTLHCVQIQKVAKKSARREQLQREEMEQRRLKTVLELQFLLDRLGDENVRQDLKRPHATGSPLLTDADLTSLDEFYKLVGPDRDNDVRYGMLPLFSRGWGKYLSGENNTYLLAQSLKNLITADLWYLHLLFCSLKYWDCFPQQKSPLKYKLYIRILKYIPLSLENHHKGICVNLQSKLTGPCSILASWLFKRFHSSRLRELHYYRMH